MVHFPAWGESTNIDGWKSNIPSIVMKTEFYLTYLFLNIRRLKIKRLSRGLGGILYMYHIDYLLPSFTAEAISHE